MRIKKLSFLFGVIFILSGCSKSFTVEKDSVTNINYKSVNILKDKHEQIINFLSSIKFSCGKNKNYNDALFTLTTNNQIYNFHTSNNYYMEYQENDKYCYTNETKKVKNLIELLNNIKNEYENNLFYSINLDNAYEENENDLIIKIDKSSEYIILVSNIDLYDFKINEVEFNMNEYNDIDLLYSNSFIEKSKKIVIRNKINNIGNYKISFTNQYNYLTTIIPRYNELNGGIVFDSNYNAK